MPVAALAAAALSSRPQEAAAAGGGFGVDVRDHGVVGDGATDDAPAIQSAIDSCPAGGRILIPPGIYRLAAGLSLMANDLHIEGVGRGATVLKFTGAGAALYNRNPSTMLRRCSISKLTIETRLAADGHRALAIDNMYRCTFSDLWLDGLGAYGTGVEFVGGANKSTYFNAFTNVDITAGRACVEFGDRCNAESFYGGVFDGPGIAILSAPRQLGADTNKFINVALQTSAPVMIKLGGVGSSFNSFVEMRAEPGVPARVEIDSGSIVNEFIGGSYSNHVTFDDAAPGSNGTTLMIPTGHTFKLGQQNQSLPKRTLDLLSANAGITLGNDSAVNWYRGGKGVMSTDARLESPAMRIGANGVAISAHLSGTAPWNPSGARNGAIRSISVPVSGAVLGDTVAVGFSKSIPAGALLVGSVSRRDVVTVTMVNHTGGFLDVGSGTVRADVWQH